MLSDYSHYAIGRDLMLVETDGSLSESIRDHLLEKGYSPTLRPEKRDYREFASNKGSPVFILERLERYAVKGVTPLPERAWLDVYYMITRKGLGFSPGELGVIFVNMLRREGVNFNRLRRYAQRRGLEREVIVFLCGLRRLAPGLLPSGALGESAGTLEVIDEMVDAAEE
jgi:hypothetical protein